jgi:hypothetical protein
MQYYFGFLLVGKINAWESTYFYQAEASYLTVHQPLLSNTNWADPLAATCRKLKANRNQLQNRIQQRKQINRRENTSYVSVQEIEKVRLLIYNKVMKAWRDNISGENCAKTRDIERNRAHDMLASWRYRVITMTKTIVRYMCHCLLCSFFIARP